MLDLEPLGSDDSRRLLDSVAPDLSSATRARVLRVAEGNPLAFVELPKTASLTLRTARGPEWLPLTQRLQAAFAARVEPLPATARTALTLLALHDSESLPELLDALGPAGTPAQLEVLEPSIAAGLVQLSDGELRFRHPLMRSAVYHLASPSSRAAGHLALARAVGPGTDRGILHRARAATGYDEALAAELELVADRAIGRGAIPAAVTTLAQRCGAHDLGAGQAPVPVPGGGPGLRARPGGCRGRAPRRPGSAGRRRAHPSAARRAQRDGRCRRRRRSRPDPGAHRPGRAVTPARRRAACRIVPPLGGVPLLDAGTRKRRGRHHNQARRGLRPTRLSDPQRAILLAYADPIGSSATVTEIMHAVVSTDLDSVTVWTLGHAASCIGDFELADMFLRRCRGAAARRGAASGAGPGGRDAGVGSLCDGASGRRPCPWRRKAAAWPRSPVRPSGWRAALPGRPWSRPCAGR